MNAENRSADTRARVAALARKLGFDLCRFARAETPEHALEFREVAIAAILGDRTWTA